MRLLKRRLVAAEQRQRAMAERDALTGLANRRAFDTALATAVEQRDRHGRSAALLLLDFDDFKAVNDTHGHPVGDEVLRTVAAACEPEVRGVDCLARIGGDEFAVIAPGAGAIGAERLAERAPRGDRERAARLPGSGAIAVTIAWATVPEDATSAEHLFRVADRRLMERKRERRQVAFAPAARRRQAAPAAAPHLSGRARAAALRGRGRPELGAHRGADASRAS